MIFLIEYDRSEQRLVAIQAFDESQLQAANTARLDRELELNRSGTDREVVLLDAADEEAIRKTHGRYFQSINELIAQVR